MKNRYVGLLIVGISLFIGFIIWLFNRALTQIVSSSCSHGPTCPMWGTIRLQTGIGIGILVLVLLIGLYMIFFAKDQPLVREIHKIKVVKEKNSSMKLKDHSNKTKIISELSDEELEVFNLISTSQGSMFQSEIVKFTGKSKVKVTRILDKLEGKGLVDRRRRGMTNVILIRHE
jgi:DNA-binding transcriptional ArsR family regulator